MSYLERVYLNWFTLGLTIGFIPSIIFMILTSESITLSKYFLIFLIFIPVITLQIGKKIIKKLEEN